MKKPIVVLFFVFVAISSFATGLRAQDRFALGAQVAVQNLPEFGETVAGYGFRFTYGAYLPFLSFDSEVNSFPTTPTGNLGETQGFFGLKAGLRVGRWGIFAKARPGFAAFGGGSSWRLTSRTDPAVDLGGGVEYYFVPHLGLRLDLSDVTTFFGDGRLLAGPGATGRPLGTQHNFQTELGLVVTP